jgi:hypothetical protein
MTLAMRRAVARLAGRETGRISLVLSTGRCGTQWLAASLAETYGDLAVVEHEPIGTAYESSNLLRRWDQFDHISRDSPLAARVQKIARILQAADYVETGNPLYGAIPTFIAAFPGRVRLIHVVRHPVTTAASIVTHDRFNRTGADREWMEAAMLDPARPGVRLPEYADRWEAMTDYEKSLFFWTEINLYGEELRSRYPSLPFIRIRFEDMMDPASAALSEIVRFIGWPLRPGLRAATTTTVDRWHLTTDTNIDRRQIYGFPDALRLARDYGYDVDSVSDSDLERRYRGVPAADSGLP